MRNCIVTLTGQKGAGKTTRLRALTDRCRRALFADPEGKHQLGPLDVLVRSRLELLDTIADRGLADPRVECRLVYRDDADELGEVAPAACFALRNITLIVDELAWVCTPWAIPPWLKRLLQFGRERRVNLVGTTREPQEIHDLFFSQADVVDFFRTQPGNGLDRIRRRYGALADQLPGLATHAYVEYGDASALGLLGREGLTV